MSAQFIFQPDTYALAECLAVRFGAKYLIDVDGHAPIGFVQDQARQLMSVHLDSTAVQDGLASSVNCDIDLEIIEASVVVCAGVLECFTEPIVLLEWLSNISTQALAVIITVSTARLSSDQFKRLLAEVGIHPTFVGFTVSDSRDLNKDVSIAVVDHMPRAQASVIPCEFCPLALIASYNEIDILPKVIDKFVNDGIEVAVLDNWSSDGTFDRISALAAKSSLVSVARFPTEGPHQYFEYLSILHKKEEISAQFPGRWIIHTDSDEIRCSPWADISLRGALFIAQVMGFNAIDYTVCDFRPVTGDLLPGDDPELTLPFFEFGRRPNHFNQVKTWRQGSERVDLGNQAGHRVQFSGQKMFPYKFTLKHYPLRGPEHARRKIFSERRPRFAPQLRARGWHIQYDQYNQSHQFLWNPVDLMRFDEVQTRREYITELIAGVGIVR